MVRAGHALNRWHAGRIAKHCSIRQEHGEHFENGHRDDVFCKTLQIEPPVLNNAHGRNEYHHLSYSGWPNICKPASKGRPGMDEPAAAG